MTEFFHEHAYPHISVMANGVFGLMDFNYSFTILDEVDVHVMYSWTLGRPLVAV